jgi:hypothetical protein
VAVIFDPPVVDDFTGSNGTIDERTSTAGPVWESPAWSGESALAIASNAVPSVAGSGNAVLDSVQYGPNIEVAITITQLGSGTELDLVAWSGDYVAFPEVYGDGGLYWLQISTGGGGPPGDFAMHRDIDAAGVTLYDGTGGLPGLSVPESFGFSLIEDRGGTRVRVYRKLSGAWALIADVLDTAAGRPSGLKYVGFEYKGATTGIADDFRARTYEEAAGLPDLPQSRQPMPMLAVPDQDTMLRIQTPSGAR